MGPTPSAVRHPRRHGRRTRHAAGDAQQRRLAVETLRLLGWGHVVLVGVEPDLALLVGAAPGLERGQLPPHAVPVDNPLHHPLGPAVLATAASVDWLGLEWVMAALAWGIHIARDRSLGYGLRSRAGFQRG